jgi:hypothetical protein
MDDPFEQARKDLNSPAENDDPPPTDAPRDGHSLERKGHLPLRGRVFAANRHLAEGDDPLELAREEDLKPSAEAATRLRPTPRRAWTTPLNWPGRRTLSRRARTFNSPLRKVATPPPTDASEKSGRRPLN